MKYFLDNVYSFIFIVEDINYTSRSLLFTLNHMILFLTLNLKVNLFYELTFNNCLQHNCFLLDWKKSIKYFSINSNFLSAKIGFYCIKVNKVVPYALGLRGCSKQSEKIN